MCRRCLELTNHKWNLCQITLDPALIQPLVWMVLGLLWQIRVFGDFQLSWNPIIQLWMIGCRNVPCVKPGPGRLSFWTPLFSLLCSRLILLMQACCWLITSHICSLLCRRKVLDETRERSQLLKLLQVDLTQANEQAISVMVSSRRHLWPSDLSATANANDPGSMFSQGVESVLQYSGSQVTLVCTNAKRNSVQFSIYGTSRAYTKRAKVQDALTSLCVLFLWFTILNLKDAYLPFVHSTGSCLPGGGLWVPGSPFRVLLALRMFTKSSCIGSLISGKFEWPRWLVAPCPGQRTGVSVPFLLLSSVWVSCSTRRRVL